MNAECALLSKCMILMLNWYKADFKGAKKLALDLIQHNKERS